MHVRHGMGIVFRRISVMTDNNESNVLNFSLSVAAFALLLLARSRIDTAMGCKREAKLTVEMRTVAHRRGLM
jgi:hypothetical protein